MIDSFLWTDSLEEAPESCLGGGRGIDRQNIFGPQEIERFSNECYSPFVKEIRSADTRRHFRNEQYFIPRISCYRPFGGFAALFFLSESR